MLVAGGSGGVASQQKPASPSSGSGVIAGRVVEAGTSRPVEEAVVTLGGAPGGERRVMVDEQGRFVFLNLPAGRYSVEADQFGYVRGGYRKFRPDGGDARLELADGQRVIDADVQMWRFASITGRVVDDAGEPLARVNVVAVRPTTVAGRAMLTPAAVPYAATDDRGVYRLAKLVPGTYGVLVPARTSTFPIEAIRSADSTRPSLGVSEAGARLGNERYLPIGDHVLATMSYAPWPPAPLPNGQILAYQGTFFPAAVSADQAEVFTLGAGEERSAIDIRLAAVPTVSVSGVITGPEGPVVQTPFKLVRADRARVSESMDLEVATGFTDSIGRFTLLGIPRGQYELRMPSDISYIGEPPARQRVTVLRATVTVGEVPLNGVNVAARYTPTLRGKVQVRSGAPIDPATIEMIVEAFDPGAARVVNPRVDKSFTFAAQVLPGRYLLAAFSNGERCGSVSVNGRAVGDALVPIESEDVEAVFDCAAVLPRLTARVRDDKGLADGSAQLVVFPADRQQWQGDDYRPLRIVGLRTNAGGTATLANLPIGEYFVASVPEALGNTWKNPRTLDMLARSSQRLTLDAGTRTIDLVTVNLK